MEVAKKLGPGHTIVTILCDSGQRYAARLFNKSWLQQKGLSSPRVNIFFFFSIPPPPHLSIHTFQASGMFCPPSTAKACSKELR